MRVRQAIGLSPLLIASVLTSCFLTEPDNLPPEVIIVEPTHEAQFFVGDTVEIVAEASDSDGVGTGSLSVLPPHWDRCASRACARIPHSLKCRTVHDLRRLPLQVLDELVYHEAEVSLGLCFQNPVIVGILAE